MGNFIVYKHTFPNGKVYIGITYQKANDRWQNGLGYRNQPLMRKAINKYGWENITHEIVYENLSKEEACNAEIMLIARYNSTDSNYGYNGTHGGDHYEMTESHKKKISKALKNKPSPLKGTCFSEDHKKKIGEANKGKKRTTEQKKRQSEYMKNRINGEKNPRARSVLCVEPKKIFGTVTDAAKWANVSRMSVSDALNGRSHTSGGFHWEYI